MKTDLDSLMQDNAVDALLVCGPGRHNPAMVYLTGGAHLSQADLVKKRGEPPVLFHLPMERDEAARTGLHTHPVSAYSMTRLVKEAQGDRALALALRYRQMLADCGVTQGRVAIYGVSEIGQALGIFMALQRIAPGLDLVSEQENSLLLQAMMTKDGSEIERIRCVGQATVEVVDHVAQFLSACPVREDTLIGPDGEVLLIRDVKRRINLWLQERELDDPEGVIFAIGRDAAVPHSSGSPGDRLRLGQTIVFDIFPCERGGGYFYDLTRTWCVGHAPPQVRSLFDDVRSVYRQLAAEATAGTACVELTWRACELFEEIGHPTFRSHPGSVDGFVHPLGHGVGLNIHEKPAFGGDAQDNDVLAPGMVITIEPGLYYPQRGMGVRLEDTLWVTPEGKVDILADYPMELVLPLE